VAGPNKIVVGLTLGEPVSVVVVVVVPTCDSITTEYVANLHAGAAIETEPVKELVVS
jgi:hypothetical protein